MTRVLLVLLAAVALVCCVGCPGEPSRPATSALLFEAEGVKVYRFRDDFGNYHLVAISESGVAIK